MEKYQIALKAIMDLPKHERGFPAFQIVITYLKNKIEFLKQKGNDK